jgi:ATP-dependent RNA helicase DeaD
MNKAQKGYHRLFINLGKRDGFYPGELMKTLNRYVGGRQMVGHIDLLDTISYFEVPEKDARKVITQLNGIRFHGRQVRCNSEEESTKPVKPVENRRENRPYKGKNDSRKAAPRPARNEEIPDFSEEGWAWRKPRKKKK